MRAEMDNSPLSELRSDHYPPGRPPSYLNRVSTPKAAMDNRSVNGCASRRVLLIGPGELPDATQRALHAAAAHVTRLAHPTDAEIRQTLTEQIDSVIVCARDDAVALRLALIVEYIRPGVPLIV